VGAAVDRAGRKAKVLAGLLTEAWVALTTSRGLAAGLRVIIVADACGASTPVAQDISLRLLESQGGELRTRLQFLLELQREYTRSAAYKEATDSVKAEGGASGIALNYPKAMISP
jgi:nicotinamidase-related amidase